MQNLYNLQGSTIQEGVKRSASDACLDNPDDANEFILKNIAENIANQQRQPGPYEHSPVKHALPNGKKTKGRVKIKMEFIDNKLRRYTTFSKRKTGIMKKAYELSTLTGTQVMLLVASETGHVYTFATRKLQPMITSDAGKALIQTCLNSPDPPSLAHQQQDQRMSATGYEEPELSYAVAEDDCKSPQLAEEYFNGSSSCSGSESSLPGSPSSPLMHPRVPSTSISPIVSNAALSSGGSVKVENTSSTGVHFGGTRSVIFSAPQTCLPDKKISSLIKIPSHNFTQNEGGVHSLVSLPLELSPHDEAIVSSTALNAKATNLSQCIPTDLSLPIKREYET